MFILKLKFMCSKTSLKSFSLFIAEVRKTAVIISPKKNDVIPVDLGELQCFSMNTHTNVYYLPELLLLKCV